MKLEDIIIHEHDEQYESLALSLQAIATAARVNLDYDDICAALGVSFSAVSVRAEPTPAWWTCWGRDLFLEPAAALFNLSLAPVWMPTDTGADGHALNHVFEQRMAPAIVEGLEQGMPTLAWQGWPQYSWPFWGVITAVTGEGFRGTTLWAHGEPCTLVHPPVRCHVLQDCDPVEPRRTDLWSMAMRHADIYMNRAPFVPVVPDGAPPAVVTGPAAFDAWEWWLQKGEFNDQASGMSWNEHRQHAEFIASARASAGRFLRRMREMVPPGDVPLVAEAIACCDDIVARLSESRDTERVKEAFATRRGWERLLADVHATEAADRRLAMKVAELVGEE